MPAPTAADLLAMAFSGHEALLDVARNWRLAAPPGRPGGPPPPQLVEAYELLRGLRARYQLVPDVVSELLLVQMDVDPGGVERTLAEVDASSPLFRNEEFICRTARLLKDRADAVRAADPGDVTRAEWLYAASERRYEDAYRLDHRRGHYPGVNVAALRLVRAALAVLPAAAADLAKGAADRADELLARRAGWSHTQPRDAEVWHPATAADCHLIRKGFADAGRLYAGIPAEPWERRSIGKQVKRIAAALAALGETVPPPFAGFDPDRPECLTALFPPAARG